MTILVPLPFVREFVSERVGHQATEGRCEVAADDLIVVDVDVLEHALVQVASDGAITTEIVSLCVCEQSAAFIEPISDPALAYVDLGDELLRGGSIGRDPGLFPFEMLDGDGIRVVGLQEFLALTVELGEPCGRAVVVGPLVGHDRFDVFQDEATDLGDVSLVESDGCPVVLDKPVDDVDLSRAEAAAVLVRLATETVEVVVKDAAGVAALLESQRLTALTTIDRALQVMAVNAGLLAALVPSGADPLDVVEEFL